MVLLHIGSMPHDLTIKNIELFCREVFPHFRGMWDDQWENKKWWPTTLREKEAARKAANGTAHQAAQAAK